MRLYNRLIPIVVPALVACATGAALHAQTLVTLGTSSGCGNLTSAQTCTLTARVTGSSQAAVTWSFVPTVAGAVIGAPAGPDTTGLTTITYKAPNLVAVRQTVTATVTAVDGTRASAFIQLVPPTITVQVTPASVNLNPGESRQFSATVLGVSDMRVTWSIGPLAGSIDQDGLYTAPASVSAATKVTVSATSVFDPTVSGTATVNLQAPAAVTISITPATVNLTNGQSQQFVATVQNATTSQVTWSISPQVGSIDANGLYFAPALISSASKVTVTAVSAADPSKSATATVNLASLVDVGLGSPTPGLQQQFVTAYYRNGFSTLVSLPPLANVKALGATGYYQEFQDAAKTAGVRLALVTASPTVKSEDGTSILVVQLLASLYAYFTSVGVTTAGYPLMDTQFCPAFEGNSCTYDFFDKNYVLFAYANSLAAGQNFTISGTYYTEWTALGGIGGAGRPVSAPTALTASTATTASAQFYSAGAIYSITSGVNRNKVFGVKQPIYDLYVAQAGPSGPLGFPTSELLQVSTGVYRQTFEGGALQYAGGSDPVVQLPVRTVLLQGASGSLTMSLGQTITLTATTVNTLGEAVTDRPVSWSSTNSKVIAIQATGATAVLTAAGPGTASVQAASQGVASVKVNFIVIAPCCQVGDGAPTNVQRTFQEALARNHITVQLPASAAAQRVGEGYIQMVQSAAPSAAGIYMLAQSDRSGTAFVVTGALLAAYQRLGGPAGALGYPAGDATPGGTQLFANQSALAGIPVRLVSGVVLAKWAALGYESGAAGPPVSDALPFTTFGANSGHAQMFGKGAIFGAISGPRAGQAYLVGGLILSRYSELGGASGDFGMPAGDEFSAGAVRQQNFEGGNITYTPGDAQAVEFAAPKVPGIVVAPASLSAGGRARAAVMGFPSNSTLRVSMTGRPDFLVTTTNGAYSWEIPVPLTAKSGTMVLHAVDTRGTAAADATLTIRGFVDNRVPIAKVQGDNQTGPPGATLPLALRVALVDTAGAPVVSAPVAFTASPGAALSSSSAFTDAAGRAEVYLRLPAAAGITAVTVEAPSIAQAPVTFYARADGFGLTNFPKLTAAGSATLGNGTAAISSKGALLTAVASILRYRQNRGELPAPNGPADPIALNQFLTAFCTVDAQGVQVCDGFLAAAANGEQVLNLWRAAEFTGGVDVAPSRPSGDSIADLLAKGSPVLLSLALTRDGAPAGGHFVVATGVADDGSILIHDPSPLLSRGSLSDYLNGFSANGAWRGELRGVVDFALGSRSSTRFLVAAVSQPPEVIESLSIDVQSAGGPCGLAVDLPDAVDAATGSAAGGGVSRFQVCDGAAPVYQVGLGAGRPFRALIVDLASAGSTVDVSSSTPVTFTAARPTFNLVLTPVSAGFTAEGVVNAASFTAGIAPGGIMAIFGTGLSGPGAATSVEIDGVPATVLSAFAFQVNAVVPEAVQAGSRVLRVRSAFGESQRTVDVSPVAPAIFLVGAGGAVANQDYSLNGSANPLTRGQTLIVYATGLGPLRRQGQFSVVSNPVTVLLGGQELAVSYAGAAPGYPGVYQVNIPIPAAIPPGIGINLTLKQGGTFSNAVLVALQ